MILFMTFSELDDFFADKYNAKYIKSKTDPKNLNLVLGDKRMICRYVCM